MKHTSFGRCLGLCLLVFAWGGFTARTVAEDMKLQATLIWGTNDQCTNKAGLKPVSPAVAKKFKDFKWSHYYEIARTNVTASASGSRVQMSKDCDLDIKLRDNGKLEVTLIGKGQTVGTIQKELRKGGCLATGGEAKNSTGWFILMKRIE